MALEDVILKLAAAFETHAAAIDRLVAVATSRQAAANSESPPAASPSKGPQKKTPAPAAASTPAPSSASAADGAAAPSASVDGAAVNYQTVRKSILRLSEIKGHQIAVGVLAEFGCKNGKDLKPAQWPDALTRIAAAAEMPIAQLIANFEERIA